MIFDPKFEENEQSFDPKFEEISVIHDGQNGATFFPNVSEEGVLSWTNDRELPNPDPVNIKGADGKDGRDGVDGKDGYTPIKGVDYFDGKDGKDGANGKDGEPGKDGKDGYTPVKDIDYFDGKDGKAGADGKDGYTPIKGKDYFDGEDGVDGISPTVSVSKNGNVTTINILDKDGLKTATINDGTNGKNGQDGKDGNTPYIQDSYWYIGGVNTGVKARGEDGSSVTITSSHISNEAGGTSTITFSDGTIISVKNGINGKDGKDGTNGSDGVSVTHSWNGTVLTITSASGTTSADLKGQKGDKGEGFSIAKTYTSIVAMNAGYYSDGVPLNGFVLIETGDVNDEDNAKLFVKGDTKYNFLTDLSGSQGIQGEKGEDGSDGRGITSIAKTSTSGLVDTYTITYTNNTTSTFTVTNGSKGKDGTSVTVSSVTETTEDGGTNTVTFSDGKTLSVKNGAKGSAGKSAYEYAKDGGYTGTEAEFAEKIAKEIPTKVSQLTNDSKFLTSIPSEYVTETELNAKGYLTSYTESDPTVPDWAKASSKPSYSKSEVGLGKVDNVKQYSASNPPPYPVTKVNGKTGAVTLRASDVGAVDLSTRFTLTAVDKDGVTHAYTVYGKKDENAPT